MHLNFYYILVVYKNKQLPTLSYFRIYFFDLEFYFAICTFVTILFRIMNTRLQQFLAAENISQAQFADTIQVARASVSHVLAGRNKPGYDFIRSIAAHYPQLNIEWLIAGKGKMYKKENSEAASEVPRQPVTDETIYTNGLFPSEEDENKPSAVFPASNNESINKINTLNKLNQEANNQRVIEKIIIFYSDNTYQELK